MDIEKTLVEFAKKSSSKEVEESRKKLILLKTYSDIARIKLLESLSKKQIELFEEFYRAQVEYYKYLFDSKK